MRIAAQSVALMLALAASGCYTSYRSARSDPPALPPSAAPTPRAPTVTEFGVRTVRLEYALPGRPTAPTLISFQQIRIVDDSGRPCPVVSTNWGKGGDYWAGISFTTPADAKVINVDFTLSLDNIDYPLVATLTRIDATHWRVDYGILRD